MVSPHAFFKRSWSKVKNEVCNAVLDFLNHDVFDIDVNATNIALIPKNNSPSNVTEFRPISLCNVVYKPTV